MIIILLFETAIKLYEMNSLNTKFPNQIQGIERKVVRNCDVNISTISSNKRNDTWNGNKSRPPPRNYIFNPSMSIRFEWQRLKIAEYKYAKNVIKQQKKFEKVKVDENKWWNKRDNNNKHQQALSTNKTINIISCNSMKKNTWKTM